MHEHVCYTYRKEGWKAITFALLMVELEPIHLGSNSISDLVWVIVFSLLSVVSGVPVDIFGEFVSF